MCDITIWQSNVAMENHQFYLILWMEEILQLLVTIGIGMKHRK